MAIPALPLPTVNETHVWQLYQPDWQAALATWSQTLSPDEHDRAQRLRKAEDRDRLRLSRGGLRSLLARYLACNPAAIRFAYTEHGKPQLVHPTAPLYFNLAHSGPWIVYAFSRHPQLGIDVEVVQPRPYLPALVQRCLTPLEQAMMPADEVNRLTQFLHFWTIKEAHLKAVGLGLSYPMQAVEVGWEPQPHLVVQQPA